MSTKHTILPWPDIRNLMTEHFEISSKAHTIHALFETDITYLSALIKTRQKELGKGLSINAYIIYLLAQELNQNRQMLTFRYGKRKMVIFDEIDIFTVVERRFKNGSSVPLGTIIRNAAAKSFLEINDLLRHYQKATPQEIPGVNERRKLLKYPGFIRRWFFRRIDKNPFLFKKYCGTAAVSSLSIDMGTRAWWGIPISASPICIMPSGFYKRVVMENGIPVEKKFMSMTASLNHDIIDGAPAKRFINTFVQKLESAYGL